MLNVDFSELKPVLSGFGLDSEWKKGSGRTGELVELMKSRGQGFYQVIDDMAVLDRIENFAAQVRASGVKQVVVLGIGGSALGAICLKQAFGHLFRTAEMEVTILDNIDPVLLAEYEETLDYGKAIFIVASKSGGTPETMAQFLYFRDKLVKAGHAWQNRFIFITDPEKGFLRRLAILNVDIIAFDVPPNVGGRFSVLSSMGLLPAALMGINIREMLAGAVMMRDRLLSSEFAENWPMQLALAQYLLYGKGVDQTVIFPYAQKLVRVADWYKQLLAESIGKELDRAGKKVNIGITPLVALGATDQHSQNQLFAEGPADKFFVFMEVMGRERDMEIPFDMALRADLGFMDGVSFGKLIQTEMAGTMRALIEKKRPMVKLSFDQIDAVAMGQMFMMMEGSVALLGELFGVNAFDQPGVELSKEMTRRLLEEEKNTK